MHQLERYLFCLSCLNVFKGQGSRSGFKMAVNISCLVLMAEVESVLKL